MSARTNTRQAIRQIWAIPIALAAISVFGLIAALLSDGLGDVMSWVALAAPVLMVVWYSLRSAQKL